MMFHFRKMRRPALEPEAVRVNILFYDLLCLTRTSGLRWGKWTCTPPTALMASPFLRPALSAGDPGYCAGSGFRFADLGFRVEFLGLNLWVEGSLLGAGPLCRGPRVLRRGKVQVYGVW